MKIHILLKLKNGPWGGANQFLALLKEEFDRRRASAETTEEASIILVNSYHNLGKALWLRFWFPEKIFIHRLGPIFSLHRGKKWKMVDRTILQIAEASFDLIIFQSKWSLDQALNFGFNPEKPYLIIGNSANAAYFKKIPRSPEKTFKLVADSWSKNWNKGFRFYQFLDEHLDFERYSMTFIGNSPVTFKNIRILPPLSSRDLGKELARHDVFISAISDDAASNSIYEALSCGLPVIGLRSGGNGEIISKGGELFETPEELLQKIEKVREDFPKYRENATLEPVSSVADRYITASRKAFTGYRGGSLWEKVVLLFLIFKLRIVLLRTRL